MFKNFLVLVSALLLMKSSWAFTATCYMGEDEVFNGHVDDVYLENGYVALLDIKKNTVYFLLADCVIDDKK